MKKPYPDALYHSIKILTKQKQTTDQAISLWHSIDDFLHGGQTRSDLKEYP
jgi:hypothetical protein